MEHCTTLEHPSEIAEFLTTVVGKEKIKDIRFGYRLQNDEPAIKFKIKLKFPYSLFGKKKIEELLEEKTKYIRLAAELPARVMFSIV